MQITKEMWNKKYVELMLDEKLAGGNTYYKIFSQLVKKEVYIASGFEYLDFKKDELKLLSKYTFENIVKKYKLEFGDKTIGCFKLGKSGYVDKELHESILFGDDCIFCISNTGSGATKEDTTRIITTILYTIDAIPTVLNLIEDLVNKGNEIIKKRKVKKDKVDITYGIATNSIGGIKDTIVRAKVDNIDLNEFNEDLPDTEIKNFLQEDRSGILIFHGMPGCGKTSYIKHLMMNSDNKFVYLGLDILSNTGGFRDYVMRNAERNLVLIIEDCERIIKSREDLNFSADSLSEILNVSDGLIGDFAKTKFIFTFNTDISKIDTALLRDGRLSCEYEFKPLQGEKLEKLAKKLGVELEEEEKKAGVTLAKLYSETKAIRSKKDKKKIGF